MNTSKNLNQSINYQDGSIVSKEIINKATGTVTLFAFDKGQGLSEHTAPYDALIIITEGEAEVVLSGVKHQMKVNEMLLMPANSTHALNAIKAFKMMLIMIK